MRLSDIMGQLGLASYAEVGLVIFLAVFVALVARTLLLTKSSELLDAARIPLDNDGTEPSATPRRQS